MKNTIITTTLALVLLFPVGLVYGVNSDYYKVAYHPYIYINTHNVPLETYYAIHTGVWLWKYVDTGIINFTVTDSLKDIPDQSTIIMINVTEVEQDEDANIELGVTHYNSYLQCGDGILFKFIIIDIAPDMDYTTTVLVTAHELGHAFGLDHSGDPSDLMYSSRNSLNKHSLPTLEHTGKILTNWILVSVQKC